MQNSELDLRQWISQQLGAHAFHLEPLPGDASFRAYFRIKQGINSYIAMLAPPSKERTDEFVRIARVWRQAGLLVPEILAWEQKQGFVLLSDFGDTLLLEQLNSQSADSYYQSAMQAIIQLQQTCSVEAQLPPYDARYGMLELSYFHEWFINKLLGLSLSTQETAMWDIVTKHILDNFCNQPQVTVHRDYHSRNLMLMPNATLGIIDFQDAMVGPITYDLVSLLKDCYINWPHPEVNRWVATFYEKLNEQNRLPPISLSQFVLWFDIVGLQRHLKVLGIFSRLRLRDNKPQYLKYMPRIMQYVLEVTGKYDVFATFHHYLQTCVLPNLVAELMRQNINLETQIKVA